MRELHSYFEATLLLSMKLQEVTQACRRFFASLYSHLGRQEAYLRHAQTLRRQQPHLRLLDELHKVNVSPNTSLVVMIERLEDVRPELSKQLEHALVSYMQLLRTYNLRVIRNAVTTEPAFYSTFQQRLTLHNLTQNEMWRAVPPPQQRGFLRSEAASVLCLQGPQSQSLHFSQTRIREELKAIQLAAHNHVSEDSGKVTPIMHRIEQQYAPRLQSLLRDAEEHVRWQLDWSVRHYTRRHGRHVLKTLRCALAQSQREAADCLHDLGMQPHHFHQPYPYERTVQQTVSSWVQSWLNECSKRSLKDMNAWIRVSREALAKRILVEQKAMHLDDRRMHRVFFECNRRWVQSCMASTALEGLSQAMSVTSMCHRQFPTVVPSLSWLGEWTTIHEELKRDAQALRTQQQEMDGYVRSNAAVLKRWRASLYQAALRADITLFTVALLQNAKAYVMHRCLEEGVRPRPIDQDEEDEAMLEADSHHRRLHGDPPVSSWLPGLRRTLEDASRADVLQDLDLQHVEKVRSMEQVLYAKCAQMWVRDDIAAPYREVLENLCATLQGMRVGEMDDMTVSTQSDVSRIPTLGTVLDTAPVPMSLHGTWRATAQRLFQTAEKTHPEWALHYPEWVVEMQQVREAGMRTLPQSPSTYWQDVNAMVGVALLCATPASTERNATRRQLASLFRRRAAGT